MTFCMVSSAADCVTYPTLVSFPSLLGDYWRIFWVGGGKRRACYASYENMYFWMAYRIFQRVLNGLLRTRLSCGRMIRLLAHPLPFFTRQQLVSLAHPSCVSPIELSLPTGGGGGRGWARSQIIRLQESL
jgi:hypothetical protein